MTMTFKEALIAHLQGHKVEVCGVATVSPWRPFMEYHGNVTMHLIDNADFAGACEYRVAPRTILVNGVEVPAPEKDEPEYGESYFLVQSDEEDYVCALAWTGDDCDWRWLNRGLVYLDKESAIARAQAMLVTQEVKS